MLTAIAHPGREAKVEVVRIGAQPGLLNAF